MTNDESAQRLPTPDEVIFALDRTGFILEYRVAQQLRQSDFITFLNHPFADPDTGKSREIDVVAHLDTSVAAKDFKVMVAIRLIIECKRFENPLVVIGEEQVIYHNEEPLIPFNPLLFDFPRLPSKYINNVHVYLDMWQCPSLSTRGFIGSQLLRMNRNRGKWQADNYSAYDGIIYPLAKATSQEREELQEGAFGSGDDDESVQRLQPTLFYILPALITSANIFTVDVTSSDTPTVNHASWTPLVRHFSGGTFLMDVVNFNHIDTYLQERVYPTVKDAIEILTPQTQVFDPEWLATQYGKPSDPKFDKWLSEFKAEYRSSQDPANDE